MEVMVKIVVDNRVRIEGLGTDVIEDIQAEFTHANPQYAKLKALGFYAANEPRYIVTHSKDRQGRLTVPRGGMQRVRAKLKAHGVKWTVEDRRTSPEPIEFPDHRVTLYDYQERLVDAAVAKENCLIRAPTGSGKTTAAIAMAARLKLPTLVIVWNSGLHEQWTTRLESELGIAKHDIGVVRAGKVKIKPVTIAMQQTLARASSDTWDLLNESFGVIVCDEVQRFAAKTFLQVIDKFSARYRVGISADETRKDKKEFLIYDLFGPVAAEVSRDELIDREFVHDVEVRIVPTDFEANWYRDARMHGQNPDFNKLLEEMRQDGPRNSLAFEYAASEAKANNQVVMFSHRREHCVELASYLSSAGWRTGLLLGGDSDADEFRTSVARIKDGTINIAVGTVQAIGQGLDLPTVSRGIVATPIATNRQLWGQVRGRLCRTAEGKTDAVIYYLWDQHVFGRTNVLNLMKWNRRVMMLDGSKWVDARIYMERRDAKTTEEFPWAE